METCECYSKSCEIPEIYLSIMSKRHYPKKQALHQIEIVVKKLEELLHLYRVLSCCPILYEEEKICFN